MREPLAVTGMAGIFAGAPDLEALWQRILSARPAGTSSLEARWRVPRARYLGAIGESDRTYVDRAFQVDFDAPGGEDRQVALGRDVVRRALADRGGATPSRARTGLVVATSWSAPSFFEAVAKYPPDAQLEALAEGLDGPRVAVDTACASSLYALDIAAGLIEARAAEAVVVLGLNALLTPFLYLGFAKLGALSPAGTILPFARDAAGIVPGEGAGAVVVERLDRARLAARRVHGVVTSIGLSTDGAERSVFAPVARGQALAYERAYAGVDPASIDYVEAHGTATEAGDATEVESLDAFFGPHRAGGEALPIGSCKALVGHTLAAAGAASLLKALLMLRARVLPPHLDVAPSARLDGTRLRLDRAPRAAADGRPMRIGVSSFGFGGSNAHLVVEADAPAARRAHAQVPPQARTQAQEPLAIVDAEALIPFPATTTIDAAGLRAGPRLLERIDPLQLAVTHLVRELLERNPHAKRETGVVVSSNLGGAMALRLSRKYTARFEDRPEPAGSPELTTEAIASSLPSMCSGYAAHHLDLRALHATLAGGPATFWASVLLAPSWLDGRCDSLVLAGARGGRGAAAFLVERLSHARARGARVLATLRAVDVEGGVASPVDARVTSDGRLGEASGVDTLLAVLSGPGRATAIDVRDGAARFATFLVERESTWRPAPPRAPRVPLTVALRDEALRPTLPSPAASSPPGAGPSLSAPVGGAPAADDGGGATAWVSHATATLHAYFASQRAALSLLVDDAPRPALARARARHSERAVIARRDTGSADLVVDESDPYFFDHPLDHVPGILIVAGVLQLAERPGARVRVLGARFRRFCEKAGARLELESGRGRAMSRGEVVATFDVEHAPAHSPSPVPVPAPAPAHAPALAARVHKHHAENVLVSSLERTADSHVAHLLSPPPGHFFDDGDGAFLSPLYVLEAARQAVMLGAHDVAGLPLGLPMSLLSVRVVLDGPPPRDAALALRLAAHRPRRIAGSLVAEVHATLVVEGRAGALGEVRVRAQVVDRATYARMRWASP